MSATGRGGAAARIRSALLAPETATFGLLTAAFVAGALQSPYFLDAEYLLDTGVLHVETGLLALGLTFVIVSGQIDLSVASTLTLVACLIAIGIENGVPPWAMLAAGTLLGAGLGGLNGIVVYWARLPSFVVTLATMAVFRGAAQILLGDRSAQVPPEIRDVHHLYLGASPVPLSLALFFAIALALGVVLAKSVFGRWVYACGSNEPSAFYAGLPVGRVKLIVFSLSGLLAGLAATHAVSRLGVARFDLARGAELEAITAVVLGGASIYGGQGSVLGTVLALTLLAILRTGMGLANVKAEYQLAVVGALLVFAVIVGNLARGRAAQAPATRESLKR